MSPSVMLAVAIAVFVLAVVAIRVWAHRSRARPERPVTEAEARAHASPLTRSVLSVTPRGRADQAVPLRSGRAGGLKDWPCVPGPSGPHPTGRRWVGWCCRWQLRLKWTPCSLAVRLAAPVATERPICSVLSASGYLSSLSFRQTRVLAFALEVISLGKHHFGGCFRLKCKTGRQQRDPHHHGHDARLGSRLY